MKNLQLIILNREQLMRAYASLTTLSGIVPDIFQQIGGMDEKDVKDCQQDLKVGASACVALIAVSDEMYAKNEQQKT